MSRLLRKVVTSKEVDLCKDSGSAHSRFARTRASEGGPRDSLRSHLPTAATDARWGRVSAQSPGSSAEDTHQDMTGRATMLTRECPCPCVLPLSRCVQYARLVVKDRADNDNDNADKELQYKSAHQTKPIKAAGNNTSSLCSDYLFASDKSTAKVQNSGRSWGMCSKHCNTSCISFGLVLLFVVHVEQLAMAMGTIFVKLCLRALSSSKRFTDLHGVTSAVNQAGAWKPQAHMQLCHKDGLGCCEAQAPSGFLH